MYFALFYLVSAKAALAEIYNDEGNNEYRKGEYNYAIGCYTEGIKVNCNDENLNAKLLANRAAVHFHLGENCPFVFPFSYF